MVIIEGHYFATPNKIINSGKDQQWWKIIAERDLYRVTKHHHTGYILIAKGTKERSSSHHFDQVIDLSIDNMGFFHGSSWCYADKSHRSAYKLFKNVSPESK